MSNATIKLVNSDTMAELLDCKAVNVRTWAKRGKIPSVILPNKRYAFDPQAVLSALAEQGKPKPGHVPLGAANG